MIEQGLGEGKGGYGCGVDIHSTEKQKTNNDKQTTEGLRDKQQSD